jgi:hypothetical protein
VTTMTNIIPIINFFKLFENLQRRALHLHGAITRLQLTCVASACHQDFTAKP